MREGRAGRRLAVVIVLWGLALAASGWAPSDRLTWVLEAAPVLLAIPLLLATRRSFPLTPLLDVLILLHGLILLLGAHYTYAEVPLGYWVQEAFGLARNHYDRLGHVAQGFVPAMLAREILLRKTTLARGPLLFTLVVSVALAFSAFYELVEWWSAILLESEAESFLGTQGDPWDTQWDMFLALCGAVSAQLLLAPWHDRQLAA